MAERKNGKIWWLLQPFAWLAARIATIAVTAALMGSLFVVSLAFETTTKALSWAAEAVMGRSFVSSVVAENTNLKKRERQLEKQVGELEGRNADLTRKNGDLVDNNRRLADKAEDLRGRNQRLSRDNERLKTANHALDEDVARLRAANADLGTTNRRLAGAVDDVATANTKLAEEARDTVDLIDRRSAAVGRRMLRTSTRNVASIPLESVPGLGGFVIVFVTALEISDACAMVNELEDLREFAGLERQDSLVSDICSLVPTFPVHARYKNARECREHQRELDDFYGDKSPAVASAVGAICTCLEDVGIPDKDSCYPEEIATVLSP